MLSRISLENSGSFDTWGDYIPHVNSSANTCWLNQFSALKISGPDAEKFLQGQLTCDLGQITEDFSTFGACCTAKGRVVANFNISFDGESYWLVLPTKSACTLEKHLQKYKVFFKANIDNCQESHLIFGQWHPQTKNSVLHEEEIHCLAISAARRLVIQGISTEEPRANFIAESDLCPTLQWRLADMQDGIYYVEGDQVEKWVPQHINWHLVDGISFSKGCYTGQEIVARLQYLGKAKKALFHYASNTTDSNEAAFSPTGSNSLHNTEGKKVGDVVFQRENNLLIVLSTEQAEQTLYLTETTEFPLTLQNLPYTVEKEV